MARQPDLHHEGPITAELCDNLSYRLADCIERMPPPDRLGLDLDWFDCWLGWVAELNFAIEQLAKVRRDVAAGLPLFPDYHRKIIDICLCLERDFISAEGNGFLRPEGDI